MYISDALLPLSWMPSLGLLFLLSSIFACFLPVSITISYLIWKMCIPSHMWSPQTEIHVSHTSHMMRVRSQSQKTWLGGPVLSWHSKRAFSGARSQHEIMQNHSDPNARCDLTGGNGVPQFFFWTLAGYGCVGPLSLIFFPNLWLLFYRGCTLIILSVCRNIYILPIRTHLKDAADE